MTYFLLLNKHRNLSLKRKSDYKRSLTIFVALIFMSIMMLSVLLMLYSKEDFLQFSTLVLPVIVILDLSLRFFLKKNASAAIFPYLTLPIPHKALIWYIVLSDLQSFWIGGCWLIYGITLWFCGALTFLTAIKLLLFILVNNYTIAFVKAFAGNFALLVFPLCLVFALILLFLAGLLNPIIAFIILILVLFIMIFAMFFTLEENLYNELNRFSI